MNITTAGPITSAEIAILGSILRDPLLMYSESVRRLDILHFHNDDHQLIWVTMEDLANAGQLDYETVAFHLQGEPLKRLGGVSYLAFLVEGLPEHPRVDEEVEFLIRIHRAKLLAEMDTLVM